MLPLIMMGQTAEECFKKGRAYDWGLDIETFKKVGKSKRKAFEWYMKAAEQGHAEAQYNVGHFYYLGEGCKGNGVEAIKWWRKSAEQGYVRAQYSLAGQYSLGFHIPKNSKEAMKWYLKAAEQGDAEAQYHLGNTYENGWLDQNKDLSEAVKWYKLAAETKEAYFDKSKAKERLEKILRQHPELANVSSDVAQTTTTTAPVEKKTPTTSTPTKVSTPTTVAKKELPNLDIVPNSLAFVDPTSNNAVRANGNYKIRFQLRNSGKGAGLNCKVKVTTKGSTAGVTVQDKALSAVNAGETMTVEVPVTSNVNTQDGQIEFAIAVDEPNGFGTDPQYLTVNTRAFETPMLKITDYSLTSENGSQTLKKKQAFDLQLMLQNTQHGQADDVMVSVELPQNVIMLEGQANTKFNTLGSGETKSLVYSLIVNNNYTSTSIPVKVHLKEKYGKYAEDRTINLTLDQTFASTKIAVDESRQEHKEIRIASIGSDVDKDIPMAASRQENTFAVIITNEHYTSVSSVPYAINDGEVFSIYCQRTLGIPQNHIHKYPDATYGQMITAIKDIKDIAEAYSGDLNVIFYYAGHGIPNEQGSDAYLLPIDADARVSAASLPLSTLYKELGSMNARSVLLFMDACFSGSKRGDGMLASARGVAIKVKELPLNGNMVVFSAATGNETAFPYNEQEHGLFTYFLLKKLKESGGNCTLGELMDYIQKNVRRQSVVINRKSQTPTVSPSAAMQGVWEGMKLR